MAERIQAGDITERDNEEQDCLDKRGLSELLNDFLEFFCTFCLFIFRVQKSTRLARRMTVHRLPLTLFFFDMIAFLLAVLVLLYGPRDDMVHLGGATVGWVSITTAATINLIAQVAKGTWRDLRLLGVVGTAPGYLVCLLFFVLVRFGFFSESSEVVIATRLTKWFAVWSVAAAGVAVRGSRWKDTAVVTLSLFMYKLLISCAVGIELFGFFSLRAGASTTAGLLAWVVVCPVAGVMAHGGRWKDWTERWKGLASLTAALVYRALLVVFYNDADKEFRDEPAEESDEGLGRTLEGYGLAHCFASIRRFFRGR